MKQILFLLLFVWALSACQDDDVYFDVSMPVEDISFTPMAGGAIMHYKLPSNADILYVHVRYKDVMGQEVLVSGSYASDSLILVGFNKAEKNVPARVTLCNYDGVESAPVNVTFDTKDSGPYALFDYLDVKADWNGFSVVYDIPESANGLGHVFYVGEDPMTKQPDTLLMSTFVLSKKCDTLKFQFQQSREDYDIVIRTEDFRGYMVREKVWPKIKPYLMEKLEPVDFDFLDPVGLSNEAPEFKLGKQYLFDGDKKGEAVLGMIATDKNYYTYLAGPNCLGKPLFILDMKESKNPVELRLYAMLFVRTFADKTFDDVYGDIWRMNYATKLPSSLTLYGSDNMDDDTSWEELASFEQDRQMDASKRWCERANDVGSFQEYKIQSPSVLNLAEPCYLSLKCPGSVPGEGRKKYRYLKLVVNEVFYAPRGLSETIVGNPEKYVTLHELEIYTEKED
ncbi:MULTISPECIES: DUF4959 domain-containing protein [Butyricimonas]|uniref:DUF4959 domain-containing protein n=1 Tax=Butyricimonas TaxID=574697 RepID=UPI0025C55FB9|nr:DUF4959 domain-containing protein [Butyricimonas sp.]